MLYIILSLVLLLLCFPPFYLGFLAWIALIPLIAYCQKATPRQAWGKGLIFGFLFHLNIHFYLYTSFRFVMSPWLGILALAGMSLFLALYIAVFCAFTSYSHKKLSPSLSLLAIPGAWVSLEFIRSLGFMGHTGGYLGYTQVFHPFFLQPAVLLGTWGLSFTIVFFQALLLHWWGIYKTKKMPPLHKPLAASAIFILLAALGYFAPGLFPVKELEAPIRLLLIQGNIPQEQILDSTNAPDNYQKYLNLTRKGLQGHEGIDLIIWPETVLSSSLARQKPDVFKKTEEFVKEIEVPLLTGAMFRDNKDLFNSILLFDVEGLAPDRYDKARLVPFAEYFPFPELLNRIARTNLNLGTYTAAREKSLFPAGGNPVAGIICFESYFGSYARGFVEEGARHIFVLSNDAWFKKTTGVDQHADVAALRAVETGVGVTQVANTGYTVSYNYRGEELFRSNLEEEEIIMMETHLEKRRTLYSLTGDYMAYFSLAALAYAIVKTKKETPQ